MPIRSLLSRRRLAPCLVLAVVICLLPVPITAQSPGTWDGTLHVSYVDLFETSDFQVLYSLLDSVSGEEYNLEFEGQPPAPDNNNRGISVTGTLDGDTITVTDYTLAPPDQSLSTAPGALTLYDTAVVLLSFDDNGSSRPIGCSASEVDDLMFTSPSGQAVDDLFMETTYGQVGFTGDVYGPLVIPYSDCSLADPLMNCYCSSGRWTSDAYQALSDAGIDVSGYDRLVFVFAKPNVCAAGGVGGLGGGASAKVFHCDVASIYAHELGHTLGLGHAGKFDDQGNLRAYADVSDVMGGVWYAGGWLGLRGLNARHKNYGGWLSDGDVEDASGCGLHRLSALELDPSQTSDPLMIRLPKPDTGETYFLSYRAGIGFDSNIPEGWKDKLNVHLDASSSGSSTAWVSSTSVGEAFVDPANGYQITMTSATTEEAEVEILVDRGLRQTAATVDPGLQNGTPGSQRDYTLTITNEDCLEQIYVTDYEITAAVPAEFDVTMQPTAVSLAPFESATVAITATAHADAGEGSYRIPISVDGGKALHQATVEAEFVIDYGPPTAPPNLRGRGGAPPVTLSWGASVDTGVGLSHYEVFRDGSFRASTTNRNYSDYGVAGGQSYRYKVRAVDLLGKASEWSNTVTVTVTGPPPPDPRQDPADGS